MTSSKDTGAYLFQITRRRLSQLYALSVFMLLFFLLTMTYFLVVGGWERMERFELLRVLREQEQRLIQLYDSSQNDHVEAGDNAKASTLDRARFVLLPLTSQTFFIYIVDAKGSLVWGEEKLPAWRPELLKALHVTLQQKQAKETSFFQFRLDYPEGSMEHLYPPHLRVKEAQFFVVQKEIILNNGSDVTIYVGQDVTVRNMQIQRLRTIFISIGILFALIIWLWSRWITGRAILPLKDMYLRQSFFTQQASHELRTPLSVMKVTVDALRMLTSPHVSTEGIDVDEEKERLFDQLEEEIHSMHELVEQLMQLARAEEPSTKLKKHTFDLIRATQSVVAEMAPLANAKAVSLTISVLYDTELKVLADETMMRRVIRIVLDNAIKYTPTDRLHRDVRIELVSLKPPQQAMIRVIDEGIGIPPEQIKHIFDRFYRVEEARSLSPEGYGLGLSIARAIMHAHGGSIQVQSKPGEGSTFILIL